MDTDYQVVQLLNATDRVRENTAAGVNDRLDRELYTRLLAYTMLPEEEITRRIHEVEKEWDIERTIELQASVTALIGLLLAVKVNWKWIWLAVVNQAFLLEHSIQGWCPPVALQRALMRRTRREIQYEATALRLLRGDFGSIVEGGSPEERVNAALRLAAGPVKNEKGREPSRKLPA